MTAFNYQWSYEGMTQPSMAGVFDQLTTQLAELERKIDALGSQPIQNTYYQQQPNYTSNFYHPGWQNHQEFSWDYNQSQYFAPELSHPSEFLYQPQSYEVSYQQPLPQQEKKSKLEEILNIIEQNEIRMQQEKEEKLEKLLTKFIEQVDMEMKSQEASLRNLKIQMEQLVNAFNSQPQGTSPSYSEINPKSEGKEYCEVTCSNDKELYEVDEGKLKRLHPDGEEDCDDGNKRSKIGVQVKEKEDEDDQALDSKQILIVSPVSVVQRVQNLEEYIRVDLGEGNLNYMDEFKFGGRLQPSKNAKELKEKTKRRHEKTIFAIEPD